MGRIAELGFMRTWLGQTCGQWVQGVSGFAYTWAERVHCAFVFLPTQALVGPPSPHPPTPLLHRGTPLIHPILQQVRQTLMPSHVFARIAGATHLWPSPQNTSL